MSGPEAARVYDRGYRRYDGPRGGVGASMRSVVVQTLKRVFGLRRSVWQKLPPWSIVALAFVPALVYASLGALLPSDDAAGIIPDYYEYYGFIGVLVLLFVAWAAPEALSGDRRSGMLGLYLASPLDRGTYLSAKATAIGGALLAVTLGPVAFLLVARLLAGTGPSVEDIPLLVLRIVLTGVVLSAFWGLLGAAVAALSDRRAIATAAIILVVLLLTAVANVAVDGADYPEWIRAIDPLAVSFDAVLVIWGADDERGTGLPAIGVAAVVAAWIALSSLVVWWRYRLLDITR